MELKETKPKWLREIENNSWNPELLISAISIVFIFSISDEVNDFGILMVQRYGLNPYLIYFGMVYFGFALQSLKIAFGLHLFLRGVWIALVGMNYTFPKGIQKEKLSKIQKQDFIVDEYQNPVESILALERVCSSIFSLAFTIVGISIFILLVISFILVLSLLGVPVLIASVVIISLLILNSLTLIIIYYSRKWFNSDIKWLKSYVIFFMRVSKLFLFQQSILVFSSNLNRYVVFVAFMIFSIGMGALGGRQSLRYIMFVKSISSADSFTKTLKKESTREKKSYFDNNAYDELRGNGELIEKASIPSVNQYESYLKLFIPKFKWDNIIIDSLEENYPSKSETMLASEFIKLRVNDTLVKSLRWDLTDHPKTGQVGWITFIPINYLEPGEHKLTVEKNTWDFSKEKLYFEPKWKKITFYKTD
ncbi:MAG: hypothetical protein AAF363_13680 [Bacteroidota bacterium]